MKIRFGRWSRRFSRRFAAYLPKGLYTRSLLIVIIPMILLQTVVALVFMDRHWQLVTHRLSAAVSQEIAALVELYNSMPDQKDRATLRRVADEQMNLTVDLLPPEQFPPRVTAKPLFDILDRILSEEIALRISRPFWIDSDARESFVEVRVAMDDAVMKVLVRRSQTYASNSHIFLVWMAGASVLIVGIAILFLRNQIRPIQALAEAAEDFGKGRDVPDFHPRGAREVRQAAAAFLAMKTRIERQIEQRTTMLAGVSHDLRTVLTRFKLQMAFLEPGPDTLALKTDVQEMERMLEGYLAFARGDAGEVAQRIDISTLLADVAADARRLGHHIEVNFTGDPMVKVRPDAMKRCIGNLLMNAVRYGQNVQLTCAYHDHELRLIVDDDGPGIPEEQREEVFRPFLRLDAARNQDHAGTGLGLAIARDVARGHGGDITLGQSPQGGLRAEVRVPV